MLTVFIFKKNFELIFPFRYLGNYRYGFPGKKPDPEILEELSGNFVDFLKKHDLEALIPVFVYSHEGQGYGLLKDIPTFYGLTYILLSFNYASLFTQNVEKER